jgi:hypothetical protein
MPNYQQGKIYKIVSNTDDELCYVGSTTLPLLCQRMVEHRGTYKRWKNGKYHFTSSFEMFDKFGIENCRIELIEIFPCNMKDELTKKEAYYIRLLNCVNKVIPDRTIKEYREENRDTMIMYQREYRELNGDKKAEYHKEWWGVNKDRIAEKVKEKYTCACGSTLRKADKNRHEKSLKHINYCASVSVVP